jgi:transcription factor STE12
MDDMYASLNGFPQHNTSTTGYQYPPRRAYTHPHTAPLHVATNVENDPSEATARPSNAHVHAQFHLSIPPPNTSANSAQPLADQQDRQLYGEEFAQATSLGLTKSLSRPLLPDEIERLAQLDRLKFFLATAPTHFDSATEQQLGPSTHAATPTNPHSSLYRFMLPNQEYVSCVRWGNIFHITGTDIVRALVFRFEAFGRPVKNMKKFEEGVFSDLRNLKPGADATLEEPKVCNPSLLCKLDTLLICPLFSHHF